MSFWFCSERRPRPKQGERVAVMPWFAAGETKLADGRQSYAASTMMGIDHDGAFS